VLLEWVKNEKSNTIIMDKLLIILPGKPAVLTYYLKKMSKLLEASRGRIIFSYGKL